MILRLFKLSYFSQIVTLIILTIILWLPAFLKPYPVLVSESNTFTAFLFSQAPMNLHFLGVLFGLILLLLEAFLLSYLFSAHQLTHRNNFLSGFLFMLFLSRTPEHLGLYPGLLALLFILLGLIKLLENFKSARNYNLLLTASIWFSLASLFTPGVILLYPVIWISLILFQSFSWRSIPISLIGLFLPYFFIAISYFWYDDGLLYIAQMENLLGSLITLPQLPKTNEIIEFSVSAALLILASSFIIPRIGNQVISIRKKTYFMYWFLGFSIAISFYNPDSIAREISFIPFAAVLGFYFTSIKRQLWADAFLSLIFAFFLFQNYRILFYA